MNLNKKVFPYALLLIALVGAFPACSSKSIDESDPGSLLKDAEEDIKSDHYQIAIEKLRVIKNKFPYSKYSVDAQLRLADVYFMQDSFIEAASSYEAFRDLHPKHEKISYAMFRIAKSYFNDIPDPISRDLTPALKAQDSYGEFIRRFPTDPQVDEAKKDLNSTRSMLADKELYIGNFYYKRNFYDSAKPRFEKVIALYPETNAAREAQEKIQKIDAMPKKDESATHGRK